MWWKKHSAQPDADEKNKPEPAQKRPKALRYYEYDGALRAYANRAMVLAFLCVPTAFLAVALAAYVRLQPPIVFRVDANGEAAVLGHVPVTPARISLAQGADAEPNDFEKQAFMRGFLEKYLNFSPATVNRNWADALNLMTANLRRSSLTVMEKENAVGHVQEGQITSVFHLRTIDGVKGDPLSYIAYGAQEIHRVSDHRENSSRLVA